MHELTYEPPTAGSADGRRFACWLAAETLVIFVAMGLGYIPPLIELVRGNRLAAAFQTFPFPTGSLNDLVAVRFIGSVLAVMGGLLGLAGTIYWMAIRRPFAALIAAGPVALGIEELLYWTWYFVQFDMAELEIMSRALPPLGYILLGLLLLTPTSRRLLRPTTTTTTTHTGNPAAGEA